MAEGIGRKEFQHTEGGKAAEYLEKLLMVIVHIDLGSTKA
jgi:hypothetical protein